MKPISCFLILLTFASCATLRPVLLAADQPSLAVSPYPYWDVDFDGLSNYEELRAGSQLNIADSDGDSTEDGSDTWALTPEVDAPRHSMASYGVVDLGITNSANPYPVALNSQGRLLRSNGMVRDPRLGIWSPGTSVEVPSGYYMQATGINDLNQVAGYLVRDINSGMVYIPFLDNTVLDDSFVSPYENIPSDKEELVMWGGRVFAVNNSGLTAGAFDAGYHSDPSHFAAIWPSASGAVSLPDMPYRVQADYEVERSQVRIVNNPGASVGTYYNAQYGAYTGVNYYFYRRADGSAVDIVPGTLQFNVYNGGNFNGLFVDSINDLNWLNIASYTVPGLKIWNRHVDASVFNIPVAQGGVPEESSQLQYRWLNSRMELIAYQGSKYFLAGNQQLIPLSDQLIDQGWNVTYLSNLQPNGVMIGRGTKLGAGSDVHLLLLVPLEIQLYKPETTSDTDWASQAFQMPWEELYDFRDPENQDLKFKIISPIALSEASYADVVVDISLRAARWTEDDWIARDLSQIGQVSDDGKEVWCTVPNATLKTLQENEPAGWKIASMDWIAEIAKSTYEDSDKAETAIALRDADAIQLASSRGLGNSLPRVVRDHEYPSEESLPQLAARANQAYMIAGGAGYVDVRISANNREEPPLTGAVGLYANCADILYLSTHGIHSAMHGYPSGALETIDLAPPGGAKREYVLAANVKWSGMYTVVIAGCSVLDINDYNSNYAGGAHLDSPGKAWEATGPRYLLGYNSSGPSDRTNGKKIAEYWASKRDDVGDIEAWGMANAAHRAWHACAVEKDVGYSYFSLKRIANRTVVKFWTEIPKSSW